MNYRTFTSALAAPLVAGAWTYSAVERSLQKALPKPFKRHAHTLALDLIQAFPKTYAPPRIAVADWLTDQTATLAIWKHARKHNVWPNSDLTPAQFIPTPPFDTLNLPSLSNSDELADWLCISSKSLLRFSDKRGLSNNTNNAFAPHYRYHTHTKTSGALRLIEEPKPVLKTLQRRILSDLLDLIPPSPAAYGFTKGRDCISAAALHGGEAMLICFDLRAFFPSITHTRIFGLFRTLGYPEAVARDLTGLCTVATPAHILLRHTYDKAALLAHRHLPQGAPTSPALANLSTFNLDRRLIGLARCINANYSRYADDLSFSGDPHITHTLLKAVPAIVNDEGFVLNPHKTRIQPSTGRQTTTGLIVNEKINIPRHTYDRLKSIIHHLNNPGDARRYDPRFLASLSGQIAWVERVNPARGHKLQTRLATALLD
jgi:hypothetical protein